LKIIGEQGGKRFGSNLELCSCAPEQIPPHVDTENLSQFSFGSLELDSIGKEWRWSGSQRGERDDQACIGEWSSARDLMSDFYLSTILVSAVCYRKVRILAARGCALAVSSTGFRVLFQSRNQKPGTLKVKMRAFGKSALFSPSESLNRRNHEFRDRN